jgi:cytochrome c oxidase subunit II
VGLNKPWKSGGAAGRRVRRVASAAVLVAGAFALGGCDDISRAWMPQPKDEEGSHILHLWVGAWLAAMITGVIVWGLIFYVCWRFRRRSDSEIPVQTRYNLPLEIFYTIAPVLMVIVFFAKTVSAQDAVLDPNTETKAAAAGTYNVIEVVGQQWQWTFNYGVGSDDKYTAPDPTADDNLYDNKFDYPNYAVEAGTGSSLPTLVLPAGYTTRFNLHSPDVIHDFGVPDFNMKMDVIPGRVNHYHVTPKPSAITAVFDPSKNGLLAPTPGENPSDMTFRGACYELCGLHHAQMIFRVAIVSPQDYQSYVEALAKNSATNGAPYLGGDQAYAQAGVNSTENSEGQHQ